MSLARIEGFLTPRIVNIESARSQRDLEGQIWDKETYRKWMDAFQPSKQIRARLVGGDNDGHVLEIVDSFKPPAQTGESPKMSGDIIPWGYLAPEFDAVVPSTVVFNHMQQTGSMEVAHFNKSGYQGSVWPDHPFPRFAQSWRNRLGIAETSGEVYQWFPYIQMVDGTRFTFEGLRFWDGGSRSYGKEFNKPEMAKIGYATVLMSLFRDQISMSDGDFVFVQTPDNLLFAIRKESEKDFSVLTRARDVAPLISESGDPQTRNIISAFPDGYLDYGTGPSIVRAIERIRATDSKEVLSRAQILLKKFTPSSDLEKMFGDRLNEFIEGAVDELGLYRLVCSLLWIITPSAFKDLNELIPEVDSAEAVAKIANVRTSFAKAGHSAEKCEW